MTIRQYPTPWKVFTTRLRPNFGWMIVEIIDRNGNVVLPWGAFDHLDSLAAKKRLAKLIVSAVNA